MAHEITEKDSLFVVKTPAWHGLGTVLETAPATSKEAIEAAGLDWEVQLRQVYFAGLSAATGYSAVEGSYVSVRTKKDEEDIALGIVGSKYAPLQNSEAFDFFDPLVKDGVATYETAGSLFEGRKVWILAKMKGVIEVGQGDTIDKNILLSNSHDGTSAVIGMITPIRVVCNNTLSAALGGRSAAKKSGNHFSYRHTSSVQEKVKMAQMTLDAVTKQYDHLGKIWSKMAEIKMPPAMKLEYVKKVFPNKEDAKNSSRTSTLRTEILTLMSRGTGMDMLSAHDTLWGAFNAVTEHTTHSISERKNSSRDTHVDNLWFGRLKDINDRAFDVALDVLDSQGIDIRTL
jgi:phage/plasmid-like protein (TIGR03299 family)